MKCKHSGCDNDIATYSNRSTRQCGSCKHLMAKYNMTTPERNTLLLSQDNKCKLCGNEIYFSGTRSGRSKEHAVVDHQHGTKHVRGILCGRCNVDLGNYEITKPYHKDYNNYIKSNKMRTIK